MAAQRPFPLQIVPTEGGALNTDKAPGQFEVWFPTVSRICRAGRPGHVRILDKRIRGERAGRGDAVREPWRREPTVEEYDEAYNVTPLLRPQGEWREELRDAARIEMGPGAFLPAGNFQGFTGGNRAGIGTWRSGSQTAWLGPYVLCRGGVLHQPIRYSVGGGGPIRRLHLQNSIPNRYHSRRVTPEDISAKVKALHDFRIHLTGLPVFLFVYKGPLSTSRCHEIVKYVNLCGHFFTYCARFILLLPLKLSTQL